MCYCGCHYERYPAGIDEICVCRLPEGEVCPMEEDYGEDDYRNDEE